MMCHEHFVSRQKKSNSTHRATWILGNDSENLPLTSLLIWLFCFETLMINFLPPFTVFMHSFLLWLLPRKFRNNCFMDFDLSEGERESEILIRFSRSPLIFPELFLSHRSQSRIEALLEASSARIWVKKSLSRCAFSPFYFRIATIIWFSVPFRGEKNVRHTQKKFPRSRMSMSVRKMLLNGKHFHFRCRESDWIKSTL